LLARCPYLVPSAVNALVIGVTSFFRDALVFDCLRQQVLPELCGRGRALRIWSIGCSDGQELYSIAMLLAERRVLHACELLGTDCRQDAIDRMRNATYDADNVRHLTKELRDRYMTPDPDDSVWRVAAPVRSAVRCRVANVLAAQEPGPWDLILCRNMAMYFQSETAENLWRILERCLRPGGVLVLGKAERPTSAKGLKYLGPCVYRRVECPGSTG
jgi:chemotaxis methyl-accepting protein methylase